MLYCRECDIGKLFIIQSFIFYIQIFIVYIHACLYVYVYKAYSFTNWEQFIDEEENSMVCEPTDSMWGDMGGWQAEAQQWQWDEVKFYGEESRECSEGNRGSNCRPWDLRRNGERKPVDDGPDQLVQRGGW